MNVEAKLLFLKVCAYKDGKVVIDTAGGMLGRYDPRPVQPDSLFPVFSVTKGITAGMLHWLADNGYGTIFSILALLCVEVLSSSSSSKPCLNHVLLNYMNFVWQFQSI